MRKSSYLVLALLLIPLFAYATDGVSTVEHPAKVNSVATPDKVNTVSGLAAAGGADAWYYSGGGAYDDNSYTDGDYNFSVIVGGGKIVLGGGGAITKVAIKTNDPQENNYKVSISQANSTTLHECYTFVDPSGAGWHEGTLSSPLTGVSATDYVYINVMVDSTTGKLCYDTDDTGEGIYKTSCSYASMCYDPVKNDVDNTWTQGVKVYVD